MNGSDYAVVVKMGWKWRRKDERRRQIGLERTKATPLTKVEVDYNGGRVGRAW